MESRRRSRRASSVTDNTASAYNISTILKRRAAPAPSFPSRCAAHLINLILKHGQNAGRDEIFPEPRAFVSLLHRSKPTQKALMAARESVGIKSAVPPTAMEVRCDSTLAQAAAAWAAAAGGLEPALRHLFESGHSTSAWSGQVWLDMRDSGYDQDPQRIQGRQRPPAGPQLPNYQRCGRRIYHHEQGSGRASSGFDSYSLGNGGSSAL
ncbi:unnamed protein product [Tilletia laevis]|uniref:Uncharacterized protein n=2 Tax=Tilletia TaxID=13289 RepID=A0A8X7SRW5_9BASI|nr:hypothetical protein CF336_g9485 [Tilletia laevis]KAE8180072.1 hypothetical protein CF335_g9370 [Tilletia laevis]KAE8236115.1 hypothetical protein A4X06_0g9651 [Tilletia controversa]CAD6953073.1 unnamed protein product [Tilletia laevis]CAD6984025.1 unnamed protein product [Tilletia controversa]